MSIIWFVFLAITAIVLARRICASKPLTLRELRHLFSIEELSVVRKDETSFHVYGRVISVDYSVQYLEKDKGLPHVTMVISVTGKRGLFSAHFRDGKCKSWKTPTEKNPIAYYDADLSERWIMLSIFSTVECAIGISLNKDQGAHVA